MHLLLEAEEIMILLELDEIFYTYMCFRYLVNDSVMCSEPANLHFLYLQTLSSDKTELERELKVVTDKLSSALVECRAKDDFAQKQMKIAQEAIAGNHS